MKKRLTTDAPAEETGPQKTSPATTEKPSDAVENAHAAGDGAIGKHSDALPETENDGNGAMNDEMKKEAEQY